ncbi:hypothetical protein EV182_004649 [Spiromyces aspiralis]|uniref:Uncharacterized protein n=1 Tax=Spiromyces aspiralis TaxID=68401 RepID=A0ACC1HS17_9FUNG|nr:hypothetical protein EV182_004649 [Spiromyces aspiralis]
MAEKQKQQKLAKFLDRASKGDINGMANHLRTGAEINTQEKGTCCGNVEAVKYLLNAGANPTLLDKEGRAPCDMTNCEEIVRVLTERCRSYGHSTREQLEIMDVHYNDERQRPNKRLASSTFPATGVATSVDGDGYQDSHLSTEFVGLESRPGIGVQMMAPCPDTAHHGAAVDRSCGCYSSLREDQIPVKVYWRERNSGALFGEIIVPSKFTPLKKVLERIKNDFEMTRLPVANPQQLRMYQCDSKTDEVMLIHQKQMDYEFGWFFRDKNDAIVLRGYEDHPIFTRDDDLQQPAVIFEKST